MPVDVFGPDDPRHPDPDGWFPGVAWVFKEREPISDGGCPSECRAHERPCILRAHERGAHHCVSCPWPADRRMVRRAGR